MSRITHIMRQAVWNTYIGESIGSYTCYCCENTKITQLNYECGHVISKSNGGKINIKNMRPICSICNKSMGTENLEDFKKTFNIFKNEENSTQNVSHSYKTLCKHVLFGYDIPFFLFRFPRFP